MSLLDTQGLRHEIDLEAWVSKCGRWGVIEAGYGSGLAEEHIETTVYTPVYHIGAFRPSFVAGINTMKGETRPFWESPEPITCFGCIACTD